MEEYSTLEGKTNVVYDFLTDGSANILVIIGMGGSGKSVGTNNAIQKYSLIDPNINNKLVVLYEGGKNVGNLKKDKKYIIHRFLITQAEISSFMAHEATKVVKFVRGAEQ